MYEQLPFNEPFDMNLTPYGWAEPDDDYYDYDYDYDPYDIDPDDYDFDPESPLNNPTSEYDH